MRRLLATSAAVLSLVPASMAAAQEGTQRTIDIESKDMVLAHDGRGHYLAFVPGEASKKHKKQSAYLFVGSKSRVHKVPVFSRTFKSDGSGTMQFRDPRVAGSRLSYGKSIVAVCGKRKVTFLRVPRAEASPILRKMEFAPVRFGRRAFFLARDVYGTYYYVDRSSDSSRNYDLRLYIGKRGKMKRIKLSNVAHDDSGVLLVSRIGVLRVSEIGAKLRAKIEWGNPKKKLEKLTQVYGVSTPRFIYNDLGVYLGKTFGTPCDW